MQVDRDGGHELQQHSIFQARYLELITETFTAAGFLNFQLIIDANAAWQSWRMRRISSRM